VSQDNHLQPTIIPSKSNTISLSVFSNINTDDHNYYRWFELTKIFCVPRLNIFTTLNCILYIARPHGACVPIVAPQSSYSTWKWDNSKIEWGLMNSGQLSLFFPWRPNTIPPQPLSQNDSFSSRPKCHNDSAKKKLKPKCFKIDVS